MATAQEVLAIARGDIGYVETPYGSNRTKFAAIAGHPNGYFWCATWVCAVMVRAGQPFPSSASTRQIWAWAQNRQHGLRVVSYRDAQPGDLVLYDFPGGNTPTDHIGLLVRKTSAGLYDIEGNTSSGNSGSQSNGGGVFDRYRPLSNVRGFVRVPYSAPVFTPPPPPPAPDPWDDLFVLLTAGAA